MKSWRMAWLFLLLPALATAAPAPLPREQRHPEPGGWSKPVDGLRVRLLSPQTRYRVGDAVRLVLEIQNVSGSDLAIEEPHLHGSISGRAAAGWSIVGERDGREGCPREAALEKLLESAWHNLEAGRTLRIEIAATGGEAKELKKELLRDEDEPRRQDLYFPDGDRAGVYVLRVAFTPERGREVVRRGGWGAKSLVSPPVRIELEK